MLQGTAGLCEPAKVAPREGSKRNANLIAELASTASAAGIEKARPQTVANDVSNHIELAQLQPPSDNSALDRQLADLGVEIATLRQQATADRAELAKLRAQVSEAAQRQSPYDATLDTQLTNLTSQIEKLRQLAEVDNISLAPLVEKLQQDGIADRAALAQLRTQMSEARAPKDTVTLDNQQNKLAAEIEQLRQAAAADHEAIAQLRAARISESAKTPPSDALDRQRDELIAQIEKLRQEASADRAAVAQLRTDVNEAAQGPSNEATIDSQQSKLAAQVEELRQASAADHTELARLRAQVGEAARASAPEALDDQLRKIEAEIENLGQRLTADRSMVGQLIDKLQQDATTDRATVAQLRTQVSDAAAAPPDANALDGRLAEIVAQIGQVRRETADNRTGLDNLAKQLAEAFHQLPAKSETPSAIPESEESPQSTGTIGTSAGVVLPPDTIPRIILRFANNRDSAQTRAAALEKSLRAQGIEVVKSGFALASSQANEVTYFYREDRPSAERIAAGLEEAALVHRPFAEDGSLPRPGTIEVAISR